MTTSAQSNLTPLDDATHIADIEGRGVLLGAGLVAGLIACGVPLVLGLASGWSPARVLSYGLLAAMYIGLTQIPRSRSPLAGWLLRNLWFYLLLMGGLGLALQTISSDPFLQPIIFGVPFVFAALTYPPRRTASIATFYLGLMVLGLWLSGERHPEAFFFPFLGYSSMMALIYAFTRLSVEQTAARRRADSLAADVARRSDYLARLVQIMATLTRDLDLQTVLEQVATAGRVLAQAQLVRVWLRASSSEEADAGSLRLAAAVPAQTVQPPPAEQQALQTPSVTATETALILPLVFKGEHIGVLELRERKNGAFSDEDAQLLQPFADTAAVAIENARLYERARLSATLAERNRLARELHDTIAQGLTAVTMQLEAAQRSFDRDPERARTRLGRASDLSRQTLEDVRRSVWTLAAPLIDGDALSEALEELAQRVAARGGMTVRYAQHGPPPPLGHATATQILRIVQEALQNTEKHARATEASVELHNTATELRVCVRDNGIGFDGSTPMSGATNGSGFGLVSLGERARLAGGTLAVESAPGEGTRVTFTMRYPAQHSEQGTRGQL